MNFFLQTYLKHEIIKTKDLEKMIEKMPQVVERYHQVEQSDKLRTYRELEQLIGSDAFQSNKKKITTKKYKDTEEAKTLAQLKQLKKNKVVRKYLKGTQDTDESLIPSVVKNYQELLAKTQTQEFQEKNAYWMDKNRWQNSEDGKKEARFNELKKDEDILFFLHANVKEIEKYDAVSLCYQDDFNWMNLQGSDWKAGFAYPAAFQVNHSYADANQAYVKGKNADSNNSWLTLSVNKENVTAPAWDSTKGMVMKDFAYTADVLNNADKLELQEGDTIQVKMRCEGKAGQAILLSDPKHEQVISMLEYSNKRLYCGLRSSKQNNQYHISGLKANRDIIYTLCWKKDELIWMVNNYEVYRTRNILTQGSHLVMHLCSFLQKGQKAVGKMHIDWVKVYRGK